VARQLETLQWLSITGVTCTITRPCGDASRSLTRAETTLITPSRTPVASERTATPRARWRAQKRLWSRRVGRRSHRSDAESGGAQWHGPAAPVATVPRRGGDPPGAARGRV